MSTSANSCTDVKSGVFSKIRRGPHRPVAVLLLLVTVAAGVFGWYLRPPRSAPPSTVGTPPTVNITLTDAAMNLPASWTVRTDLIEFPQGGWGQMVSFGPSLNSTPASFSYSVSVLGTTAGRCKGDPALTPAPAAPLAGGQRTSSHGYIIDGTTLLTARPTVIRLCSDGAPAPIIQNGMYDSFSLPLVSFSVIDPKRTSITTSAVYDQQVSGGDLGDLSSNVDIGNPPSSRPSDDDVILFHPKAGVSLPSWLWVETDPMTAAASGAPAGSAPAPVVVAAATDLSRADAQQRSVFYSGIGLGIAGGALVGVLQETVDPDHNWGGRRRWMVLVIGAAVIGLLAWLGVAVAASYVLSG